MDEQARKWQERFDREFPRGVLLTAEGRPSAHTYPCPRPEVMAMRGFDPVVFLDIPGYGRNMTGTVTGYETVQTSPCLVVKVTLDVGGQPPEVMLWSSNISDWQAMLMQRDRHDSLALSEKDTLYQGSKWFGTTP